jgi:hypothetical protein
VYIRLEYTYFVRRGAQVCRFRIFRVTDRGVSGWSALTPKSEKSWLSKAR